MKIITSLLLYVIIVSNLWSQNYSPSAEKKSVVKYGNVRFTILTPRVIRIEWSEDGVFEDRASLTIVNRNLPTPQYKVVRNSDSIIIRTNEIKLSYKVSDSQFNKENLSISFSTGNMKKTWNYGDENKRNLLGTTRTLDSYDGDLNTKDSTYLKLENGILSRDGWYLIDDSERPVFDNSDWAWVTSRNSKKKQDLYFFAYGYDYKTALKDFTLIAGKIPLPPKYVFGYWFSRWRPFSEMELNELVETHEKLNIPLDVLVVDMDWHITNQSHFFENGKRIKDPAGQDYGWTGFTWNKNYFPEPKSFLDWTEKKGIKVCLNLHPASGIQPHEEQYRSMARAMDIDPTTKNYVPFNIVDKKFAQNYFDIVLHPMEKEGVDFWWLDWQQWNNTSIPGVNPTFYLNYVHFTDMVRQNKRRPLIYHRWGGLGNHRYQIGFSGDTKITWNSLAFQPYFTSTAANVGFGYWGNDIGGFYGEPNTPENFLRWFQFGVYSPILKSHATGRNYSILRKIWEYPSETFLELKKLIELRYSLLPYIYTEARKTFDTGISICRPLYYENPIDEESYSYKNEYYFGDELLVHPITKPIGKDSLFATHKTWLPKGNWYEESSGAVLEGGRTYERSFVLNEIPVYVKNGAIIPAQSKVFNTSKTPESIVINIYPGGYGSYNLYEDGGDKNDYQNSNYTITPITYEVEENKAKIAVKPVVGRFKGMKLQRFYEIRLIHSFPPSKVLFNGKEVRYSIIQNGLHWNYDGQTLTTKIYLTNEKVNKLKSIEVLLDKGNISLLDNMKAKLERLYAFSKFLSDKRNYRVQTNWNDAKYSSDLIMYTTQTGLRITRNPNSIKTELLQFDKNYHDIINTLDELSKENIIYKPYLELLKSTY